MEMINVLNTIPEVNVDWLIGFALVLLVLGSIMIVLAMCFSVDAVGYCGLIFDVIGFCVMLGCAIFGNPLTYECTIKPDAKAIEFNKIFTITEQRGDIYNVVLKHKKQ